MSQLTNYVDTLISLAQQQGLSASNDIAYKVGADVTIILSFVEPVTHVFPLNGLWIIADGANAGYKKVMRRKSKTATAPYKNTWQEETDYNTVMTTVQVWDEADLPAPQIISASGGRLTGKVLTRTGVTVFDNDELIPKSYTDGVRTAMNNSFFTMFNNMNSRVNSNLAAIRTLQSDAQLLTSRVEVLEQATDEASVKGLVFVQQNADTVWALRHGLGKGAGIPYVTDERGEVLWPETVNPAEADPDNVLLLTFLEPVSGVAQLMYMPITEESQP
ncbi:HNH endonuclease [Erwinia phage pEa_SNUABM_1]|uniref:Uncharacterized protein n=1 Tax=Erwinia phage pEa_SNUABM_1 TaxID=2869543 RepID=A0AAE8BZR4_9CAUD|nr:HNH endonuclease [Erwinia phage pEa_SNUABM_1]QZE57312.1 hypothetical protein pEaSNUABM1_00103 [Erwinia phage pEa_SNUABM_1]